ncbi:MAG: MFS transporter [Streptococcaceae bacterium]|nr:MFS transporter [Streptococcaceae bacterium]
MQERTKALIAIGIFTFMSTLDSSIVNIALPTMSRELHVTTSQITWVVTVYLIVISAIILIFGRLGDLVGKSKIMKIGWAVFILGSFLAGLNMGLGLPMLLSARVIQAIGASMMMATGFGLIAEMFPIASRARALSLNAMFVSVGSIAGPALGGLILSVLSWNYIFWINVPIGIVAWIFGNRALIKDKSNGNIKDVDLTGGTLMTAVIVLVFLTLNSGQAVGWTNPLILAGVVLALAFFIGFVALEKRKARENDKPLLDLNIFKSRIFTQSLIMALLNFTVAIFSSILLPFYLQNYRGFAPGSAGLMMMAYPIAMLIFAPISGWLSDQIDKEKVTFIGLCMIVIAQICYIMIDKNSSILLVIVAMLIQGAAMGTFQSPNNALIMETVDHKYLGIAGSVNSLARNLAFVLGTSLATIALYMSMSSTLGYKVTSYLKTEPGAFLTGLHFAFSIGLVLVLISWLLGLYRILAGKRKTMA